MLTLIRIQAAVLFAIASLSCGGAEPTTPSPSPGTPTGPLVTPPLGFAKRSVTQDGILFPYQVFAPQNFDGARKWPIVIALAGTEERGNDNEKQMGVGLGPLVKGQPAFPAVVVFPQVPSDAVGTTAFYVAVFKELDDVIRDYNGDPDRVYLTGLSFGGTVGFSMLYNTPGRFAGFLAIVPGMCRSCISNAATLDEANLLVAAKLKAFPIWIHQGGSDLASGVAANRQLYADFKAQGSTTEKYTEYAGLGHVIWDMVYANPAVWDWLWSQRR